MGSCSATSDAGWRLSVYPSAGEAGGSYRSSWSRPREFSSGGGGDPERSRAEAARRARTKLRRYCASNRLNRFATLTYGPPFCSDPYEVRQHAGVFFRALRRELGGDPLPYVWVPELHKDGQRFHLHFAVGRFVPRGLIERAWGHGFVHIKLIGDLPVGSGSLEEARVAARYLSKYVGKNFSQARIPGLHRYEVAQGFQPQPTAVQAATVGEAIGLASELMGSRPSKVWQSDNELEWDGPPAVWASWGR